MTTSNTSKLKRVMCGLLSALTVLSGTAAVGTAAVPTASAAETTQEASAAAEVTPDTFSWDNATVYFLLTDRFNNGNTSNDNSYNRRSNLADTRATFHGGDFAGITQKINDGYFNDLGVDAIWLSAPYEQIHGFIQGGADYYHYSYHGYYVLDYTETDANFGTKEEFRTMVDTAHEHGIRIIMDIVMNHAGYCSMYDMNEYGFGELAPGWESWYNNPGSNAQEYQSYMVYDGSNWDKWWGPTWIRSGVTGYTEEGGSDLTRALEGLPDFRTESTNQNSLPPILQTKWTKEGTLAAKSAKYGTSGTVTDFLTKWLSEWVREYGVDGFRCDTAKHVEKASWKKLKDACVPALKEWKNNNPNKKLDDLNFWMTGEHWEHGVNKDDYYTNGFDSMINFDTTGGGVLAAGSVANKYRDYANAINNDDSFNVLSYMSSHDTTLARGDNFYLGSAFLMLPGAVQIYYGDETARPKVSGIPDDSYKAGHCLRSDMNWDSYDPALLTHWGKVGTFRNHHIAVGAGANVSLTASSGVAFGRTYSKNGLEDKIAAVIGATASTDVTINVADIWADGTTLENYYDDSVAVVSGGSVTFNSGAHGTILIQEPDGERGRVVVTHIDQDTGKTIKTETLVGLIGESYSATPLSITGYTLARTVGSKTGSYSETEGSVKFYYTFDSNNYAHITIKYVDSESGAEIAEADDQVGKIGTSYTTQAKSIKNYEVDVVPANASGTVKSGTTTVTYKYVYVEPTNLAVHYYNANNWSTVNLYAYQGDGDTAIKLVGAWPGKAMTAEGDGWYFCDVPDAENGRVMFNAGMGQAQEPAGTSTPGYEASGEVWVKGGKVYNTGKVNVKYVGSDGKVLASEVLKGMADGTTTYSTSAKTFAGYTLISTPANASGKYTADTITVTYSYQADNVVDDLVNNSTVSATSCKVGDTLTITGKASGGTTPYQYKFSYKRASQSSYTVKSNYGEASSVTLTPGYAETYTIKVEVKDKIGTVETKTMTVNVSEKTSTLANNSTISATQVKKGTTVTITGKASGGTTPYKYKFSYKRSSQSNYTVKSDYGKATSVTLTPGYVDTYTVKVEVKDNSGTVKAKTFTLKSISDQELVNNSTVSATTVNKGTTITITGKATGGSGSYKYEFLYKRGNASSWTTKSAYGKATSVTLTPQYADTYYVTVNCKDSSGTVKSKVMTITSKEETPLVNNSTVSATTVNKGTSVTITGKASGGTSPYKYKFSYKRSSQSSYTVKSDYGKATSVTLTPAYADTYTVKVEVKDNTGTVKSKTFTITSKDVNTLANNSTVSATSVTKGTTVTITGKASGGTSPYKYKFSYKRSSQSSYTVKSDYGKATSVTLTPSYVDTYTVKVEVKDNAGTVVAKTFTIKSTAPAALANNSTVSSANITKGTTITIKGAASGGTGSYTYAYYYKKSTTSTWVTKGTEFGTDKSVTLTPGTAVNYDVKVIVRDSSGETKTKTFTIIVK